MMMQRSCAVAVLLVSALGTRVAGQEPARSPGGGVQWLISAGVQAPLTDAGRLDGWSGRWAAAPALGLEMAVDRLVGLPIGGRLRITGVVAPRVHLWLDRCGESGSAIPCPPEETANVDAVVSPEAGIVLTAIHSKLAAAAVVAGGGVAAVVSGVGEDCLVGETQCEARYAFTRARLAPTLHAGIIIEAPLGVRALRLEMADRLRPRIGRGGVGHSLDVTLGVALP